MYLFCREYYFSEENLPKDFFLRRNMDKEGWITVALLSSFNRVKSLSQDAEMIVQVTFTSSLVCCRKSSKLKLVSACYIKNYCFSSYKCNYVNDCSRW